MGCTAELREVTPYSDGRYDLVTVGETRFRLLGLDEEAGTPYHTGFVEFVPRRTATATSTRSPSASPSASPTTGNALGVEVTELPDQPQVDLLPRRGRRRPRAAGAAGTAGAADDVRPAARGDRAAASRVGPHRCLPVAAAVDLSPGEREHELSRQRAAGGTPATQVLARDGAPHTLRAYDHDPTARGRGLSFGMEAALALGLEPAQVFKTCCRTSTASSWSAVVPVDRSLDLKALAAAVRGKRAVWRAGGGGAGDGYVLGGHQPAGSAAPTAHGGRRVRTGAGRRCSSAPGRRGLDVELAPADLVRLTDAVTAAVAR
jgi:Cys-tRNA(Pro)/Cys-tRNA(Cys) deacylase